MDRKHRQFLEITLREFRCFRERQTVPLAPLTLLVGENSTGKTSFLAAAQAVWDAAHGSGDPDFRRDPFDLGAFPEIVHGRGGRAKRADSFSIGFKARAPGGPLLAFEVTFESRDAAPAPATFAWRHGKVKVSMKYLLTNDDPRIEFQSSGRSWSFPTLGERGAFQLSQAIGFSRMFIDGWLESCESTEGDQPSPEELAALSTLWKLFTRVPPEVPPFASAPVHPPPRRTYDPTRLDSDPWGADVPSRFASLQIQDKTGWAVLKAKLDAFGRESGLFDDFSVKQLTRIKGGPFQLQVRKFGKSGRKGPKRNLMDVGFGVSQVLPVLAALFRADGPSMFLLQQPELHLHPSAQAALGSLFCETASSGRQLIIETHSDYIMDRVLLDIRDKRTDLKADDVSILYFERGDRDVSIHSIRIDDEGNVLDTPEGYRRFFKDELNRVIDY